MGFRVDPVGRLRPRRLREIGVEDDDQDARRQDEQRNVEGDDLAPVFEGEVADDQRDRQRSFRSGVSDIGDQPFLAVYRDVHDAGAFAEQEEGLTAVDDAFRTSCLPSQGCSGLRR
jgi:hypothetical protein